MESVQTVEVHLFPVANQDAKVACRLDRIGAAHLRVTTKERDQRGVCFCARQAARQDMRRARR